MQDNNNHLFLNHKCASHLGYVLQYVDSHNGEAEVALFHVSCILLEPEWCGRSSREMSRKLCCLFRYSSEVAHHHFCPYSTGQSKSHRPKARSPVEGTAKFLREGSRVWGEARNPLPQLHNLNTLPLGKWWWGYNVNAYPCK